MSSSSFSVALGDIGAGFKRYQLAGMLGWQDLKQRYRRSSLGPFWLTISMGVMIGMMGVVFGQIFKAPMEEYFPFLAAGTIVWGLISMALTEAGLVFVAAEGIIKQLPIPLFVHVLRMIWRNVLIFCHNILIFPLVLLWVQKPVNWDILLALPGLFLIVVNLTWMTLLLGVLCTRYRDLPQIVISIIQVVFFLTPIMWMPSLLPGRAGAALVAYNPFYHLIEVVRAPLLGMPPTLLNWQVVLALTVFGWLLALAIYGRYKTRIAYWL